VRVRDWGSKLAPMCVQCWAYEALFIAESIVFCTLEIHFPNLVLIMHGCMGAHRPIKSFPQIHKWVWDSLNSTWVARQVYIKIWSLILTKWWHHAHAMHSLCIPCPKWMNLSSLERWDQEE
jgi:hypothetical protein